MTYSVAEAHEALDRHYERITRIILSRQNPISGLLPASTAVNVHGNYTDAWVRDNVYSILAVWGLALAYRKLGVETGRTYELQQSVVKLMRGLLTAMMRQAHKVERFKVTQDPMDALHAKYDTATGHAVVGDGEWGHLQIDATSLFLLALAQMTASGLQIVYSIDEVNFVQNLIYYIGRAYRTADYGLWERGNKLNHGRPELNGSSMAMAKAALEALHGFDLFGPYGSQASVVHVLEDEVARTRVMLESLLPRESASKEVDAALLSAIGFPAFALEDEGLVDRTRDRICTKLEGRYGCKRFLRDGHQTVLEDTSRLHYDPYELKTFENIECEWPLFFSYLMLDALFRGDRATAETYHRKLEAVAVEENGLKLLPEVYYVPGDRIDAERDAPGSQEREPNDNLPLVWAQSLWMLGEMLLEGLLDPADIDPLNRRQRVGSLRVPLVQVALLAEDETLQQQLAVYGIDTQTPQQVAPIQVRHARDLSAAYAQVGRNDKLGLSGRPIRRLRSLTTSRLYQIRGETIVFLPSCLDPDQFYLSLDPEFLAAQIRSELSYVGRHWQQLGRPTFTLLLTHAMVDDAEGNVDPIGPVLNLVAEFKQGSCDGVPVRLGHLNQFVLTAGSERIDFLYGFEFPEETAVPVGRSDRHCYLSYDPAATVPLSSQREYQLETETEPAILLEQLRQSANLYEQIELLQDLLRRLGASYEADFPGGRCSLGHLVDEVYGRAAAGRPVPRGGGLPPRQEPYWAIVRRAAGLQHKTDMGLSDAVTDLLVRQKLIAVGRAYSEDATIDAPMAREDIAAKIDYFCGEDIRDRVLSQEILVDLGVLIKANPDAFKGFLTLRTSYFILLLTSDLGRELGLPQDEAYERLMDLSPFAIKTRMRQVLEGYQGATAALRQQEGLRVQGTGGIEWVLPDQAEAKAMTPPAGSWARQRQMDGAVNRVPKGFYERVWELLAHCKGIVIGDKLERRNRLDSARLRSEMTAGEKNFALQVEYLLNKIEAPTYRQACIEALTELAALTSHNPDLRIDDYVVLDVLIGYSVRLAWLEDHPHDGDRYEEVKAQAWQQFYETSPYECARFIVKAFQYLIEMAEQEAREREAAAAAAAAQEHQHDHHHHHHHHGEGGHGDRG